MTGLKSLIGKRVAISIGQGDNGRSFEGLVEAVDGTMIFIVDRIEISADGARKPLGNIWFNSASLTFNLIRPIS
jgi:hypothetical protein